MSKVFAREQSWDRGAGDPAWPIQRTMHGPGDGVQLMQDKSGLAPLGSKGFLSSEQEILVGMGACVAGTLSLCPLTGRSFVGSS